MPNAAYEKPVQRKEKPDGFMAHTFAEPIKTAKSSCCRTSIIRVENARTKDILTGTVEGD